MMAMAVTLTACSDDDDYVVGQQSHGAYFPEGQADEFVITTDQTPSFKVEVDRVDFQSPAKYELTYTVEPACDGFNVPTEVTFAPNEKTADLVVTFDPEKVTLEQVYNLTFTLKGASDYGSDSYSCTVKYGTPNVTELFGTGNFIYSGTFFEGDDPGLEMFKSYNPAEPNKLTLTIEHWGQDAPLVIEVPDMSAVDANGNVCCHVPLQYVGYTHPSYGRVFVGDIYYYDMYLGASAAEADADFQANPCYYTPEKGLFTLNLAYFVPEYGDGTSWFGQGEEYFQLDGFPEYDVTVDYMGLFTTPAGTHSVIASVTSSKDVAAVKAILFPGNDSEAAVNAILNGDERAQDVAAGEGVQVLFPVTEGGQYVIAAVSYNAKGEACLSGVTKVDVEIGGSSWSEAVACDFIDGWALPAFGNDPNNFPTVVNIRTSSKTPGLYQMVNPYGPTYVAYTLNKDAVDANVSFTVEGTGAAIQPQISGFCRNSDLGGDLTIGNFEGYLIAELGYPDIAAAQAFMATKDFALSTVVDGIVEVPEPLVGAPAVGDGSFGYTWKNVYPSYIGLPGASAAAKHKAHAKMIAAPRFNSLSTALKANKLSRMEMLFAKKHIRKF